MTDKELIKQEIERRVEQCYRLLTQDLLERERNETNCSLQQYKELLQFIDSLPEEHNEDLEREISKWRSHYISVLDNNLRIDLRDIEVTANHFAEWQKQQDEKVHHEEWMETKENHIKEVLGFGLEEYVRGLKEKEDCTSDDLEEAAHEHAKENYDLAILWEEDLKCVLRDFKAGANWQREQMLKDAVEAFVNTYENTDDSNYVEFVTEQSPCEFKELEKCKILIVKED